MQTSNRLLTSLSQSDASKLMPHLKQVELCQKHMLFEAGDTIDVVYFPTSAIVSLVVPLSDGELVEAAMVGNDGVVGAAAALNGRISLSRAIVQLGGYGMICPVDALKATALQSQSLLALLVRHEQTVYAQAQQSAACIAAHSVEQRLCRWLLRARDLARSDVLMFTHEFLAEMLGVRRTSVSIVAHALQQAGMIKYARGKIQIINLQGLREASCECYSTVRRNYEVLMEPVAPK